MTPLPDTAADLLTDVRSMVSIGTPDSLLNALEELQSGSEGESEAGRDLQAVAWFLLETVYPLRLPGSEPPEPASTLILTELFETVRSGTFPALSQDEVTFLTSLISPVSLLFSDSSVVWEQCREVLEQLKILNPASILPIYLSAVLHEREGDNLSALEEYTEAVERDDSVYPAALGIARIQMAGGHPDKAVINLERLNESFPERIEVLKLLGETYYLLEDYEKALNIAADTLLLVPDDTDLLFLRAKSLFKDGRPDQARRILTIVERERPAHWEVLHLKALLEIERGNTIGAVDILARALEIAPENSLVKNTYGEVLMAVGRGAEARALLTEQLASGSGETDSLKSLEVLLADALESKAWAIAGEYSDQILALRREKGDLLLARDIATALGLEEEVRGLEEELYLSFSEDPEIAEIYIRSLIGAGENGAAVSVISDALEGETDFSRRSRLYYLRSLTAENESEKIENLRSALLEDLENGEALMELSAIYYSRRDFRNAYRYIKQASLLDPDNEELSTEAERIEELIP